MAKNKNAAWRFFASVKLALINLIILAATSIIGTLIKQGQEPAFYIKEYGSSVARLCDMLALTDMYRSWWFITLLGLFAVNLVVCSIERLPGVWRTMVLDNLAIDLRRLEGMGLTHQAESGMTAAAAAERMQQLMTRSGWKKPRRLDREGTILLFAQKGAWTRTGVYIVHLSILVILAGVMLGSFFGFEAFVFIPEGRSTSNVFLRKDKAPLPLGFDLRCDRFEKTFYPNGMVKQYRADLTVIDPEREAPFQKSVVVNDPLSHKGLNFFVGDAYPMEEFFITLRNQTTGLEQDFRVPPERDVVWQSSGLSFRIEELQRDPEGVVSQAKIRLSTATATEPAFLWIKDRGTVNIQQGGEAFTISFRQLYSTLLLVTKDPGVLIVYFGCILMICGLATSFLLSHRRLWLRISTGAKQGSQILLSGTSNKNKPGFERRFQEMVDRIGQEFPGSSGKKF